MNESEINEVWRRMIKVDQIHSEVVRIQYSKKQYFNYDRTGINTSYNQQLVTVIKIKATSQIKSYLSQSTNISNQFVVELR